MESSVYALEFMKSSKPDLCFSVCIHGLAYFLPQGNKPWIYLIASHFTNWKLSYNCLYTVTSCLLCLFSSIELVELLRDVPKPNTEIKALGVNLASN